MDLPSKLKSCQYAPGYNGTSRFCAAVEVTGLTSAVPSISDSLSPSDRVTGNQPGMAQEEILEARGREVIQVEVITTSTKDCSKSNDLNALGSGIPSSPVDVALLTAGTDRPYVFGLAMALASEGVRLDIVGSDAVDSPEMHTTPEINFRNLRGSQRRDAGMLRKVARVLIYYARLIGYTWAARPSIFHILWNNKFEYFDRTLLMLYYKVLGKKIVLTAHNVNAASRDKSDSLLNRWTLRIQYRIADHIFVHTKKMKDELHEDYGVAYQAASVIPFGINNAVPHTELTSAQAKRRLGISEDERTILFFGNMRSSKGLEYLLAAFQRISAMDARYRLIIAGQLIKDFQRQWREIQPTIRRLVEQGLVILRNEFIPDQETELYFKAADVLVLSYTQVFQSGVLFLGYSFGLPVIATDVGSFREDIIEGETGFLCKPVDSGDLAKAIEKYFKSDLFKHLDRRRQEIQNYAETRNSWKVVAEKTRDVYTRLSSEDL